MSRARTRVALLVAPDSFERFFGRDLGLDREAYVREYRNDFVWTYASGLRSHGVDVVAYVPSLAGGARVSAPDGFEVRFLHVPPAWDRLRGLVTRAITPLERYAGEALHARMMLGDLRLGLREDAIDVLYLQEYWTARFDLLTRWIDLPVVAGEHGGSSGRHVHVLKRRALARASAITVQSSAEQRRLRERYGREAELVTNGVDTHFFSPGEHGERPPRMLVVARLVDAQKRVSDVISALARMPSTWGLDIIGRGPDEDALRDHARRLGCADRVTFHGWISSREALRAHYRRAGVFVLPSMWEAVTLAVLEAMACATPPVVTPLAPFRDAVVDGVNGALVPLRDVERLAELVLETYANREALGAAARRTAVERYDRDATLGRLATLLHAAAAQGRPATVTA